MRFKRGLKIGVATASAVGVLFIGGIGFLHTPAGKKLPMGRKILSWMSIVCPLDTNDLTATQVEHSRQVGVTALRGKKIAPARPTLTGLEIDQTTEEQAWSWANARGISCRAVTRGMHFIKCEDMPAAQIGRRSDQSPIGTLTLGFDPQGKLVAVDLFRRKLAAAEASRLIRELSNELSESLGKPTSALGDLSPESLTGNEVRTGFVNYQFRNYLAMLSATNIPWSGGVALHEQYSSIPNSIDTPPRQPPASPKS